MITLYGLRVPKDSIKEVVTEGGCYYALTDDFMMINITKDECVLVYRECPKIKDNDVFKKMFGGDGQEENV